MCGGIYEEDGHLSLENTPTKESEKKPMGDIKFMTAADFMDSQELIDVDKYIDLGQDCQV